MKMFQSLLFYTVILLLSSNILTGQNVSKKLQLGLGANGILSVKNWSTFQSGIGSEFQLWLEKPLSSRQSLKFMVAYRQLTGFQMKSVEIQERYFANEFQSHMQTKDIASLDYLDASINWHFKLKENAPWSLGLGMRWSYLTKWKAHEQQMIWVIYNNARITETSFGGGTNYSIVVNESIPLPAENFNRHDLGLLLHFGYEFTRGLQLKASYDHGFNPVLQDQLFPQHSTYRVSTFSIGLSARLF